MKTARFCRAVFILQKSCFYSPPPKRRDHHPARRGCDSSLAAGAGSGAASAGGSGGAEWAGGDVAASGWALTGKLTFSRTVERRRAVRSAS
jgi:hypothetical protein